jgi:hypothetical protein
MPDLVNRLVSIQEAREKWLGGLRDRMSPDNGVGPPEKERPGASHDAEPNQQLADTTPATIDDNRPGRQTPYDALAGNRLPAGRQGTHLMLARIFRNRGHD